MTMVKALAIVVALGLALGRPLPAAAITIDTQARHALIVDFETGATLLEKEADVLMPPSSMSKIMTAYMIFDAIKKGRLKLDDEVPVSEKAWRMGGSKMFVQVGSRVKVEDLIRGIIVQSGNDACVVMAEALAGSEAAFAEQMTQRARELGLTRSTFRNASGWPEEGHLMTARDLAILARRLIIDFPEHYHYYAQKEFTFNGIKQGNRNPLLYKDGGGDGLKTGHTEAAGYGLTASAKRGERRLIMVVNGLPSIRARIAESERLMDWAFREFDNVRLFKRGEVVEQAEVWLGEKPTVPLTVAEDLVVTMPRAARKDMKVTLSYTAPLPAPVVAGAPVGRIVIDLPDQAPRQIPVVAGGDVSELGVVGRVASAVGYLLWGSKK
ncbi:MAG: D-alanyl-D-alanine carboxypeptidase family protein [Thalassobaculales bacterium]